MTMHLPCSSILVEYVSSSFEKCTYSPRSRWYILSQWRAFRTIITKVIHVVMLILSPTTD